MNQTATAEIQTEKPQTPKNDIWAINEIPVSVTIPALFNLQATFFCRLQLNREAQEIGQIGAGMTPEEKQQLQHKKNVEILASLATRAPEGLPGFPEVKNGNAGAAIREFFSGENEAKMLVCREAVEEYYGQVKRQEFFRSV